VYSRYDNATSRFELRYIPRRAPAGCEQDFKTVIMVDRVRHYPAEIRITVEPSDAVSSISQGDRQIELVSARPGGLVTIVLEPMAAGVIVGQK
jgi:hypothetical protein